ncbi:hypothetical protein V6N13_138467 [Hibiscus sabdariffa]
MARSPLVNSVISQAGSHTLISNAWLRLIGKHCLLSLSLSRLSQLQLMYGTQLYLRYICVKKRSVIACLRGAQCALARRHSSFLVHLEHDLQLELESLLDQDELLWRQNLDMTRFHRVIVTLPISP